MSNHIGKLILNKIHELGMNKSEFARRINKSRQNVQDIFQRDSLDTHLLVSISKVLNYNFLEHVSDEEGLLSKNEANESQANYQKSSKSDKDLQIKMDSLRKEMDILRKEIAALHKTLKTADKKNKKNR